MGFTKDDLENLSMFLDRATGVVTYITVSRGLAPPGSIAMRHDVDHDLNKAHRFALWENERGYRSTYFILTTARYWIDPDFSILDDMISMGHEIGFHNDSMNAPGVDGDPSQAAKYITQQVREIQEGLSVDHYHLLGVADHGGAPHTNTDVWDYYPPGDFNFEYEAYQLQKTANTYISDNQGKWRSPLKFAQTFMLVHPIWWPV